MGKALGEQHAGVEKERACCICGDAPGARRRAMNTLMSSCWPNAFAASEMQKVDIVEVHTYF